MRLAAAGLSAALLLGGCDQRVCRKLAKLPDKTGTCGELSQVRALVGWQFEGAVATCEQSMNDACDDTDRRLLWGFVTCYAALPACRVEDVPGFLDARLRCAHPARQVSPSCLSAWGGPSVTGP